MRAKKLILARVAPLFTACVMLANIGAIPARAVGDESGSEESAYWTESVIRDGVTGKLRSYSVWAVSDNTYPFGTELVLNLECKQRKLAVSLTGDQMYPDSNSSGRGSIQVRIDRGKFQNYPFSLSYLPWDISSFNGVVFGNPESLARAMLRARSEVFFKYRYLPAGTGIYPEYHSVSFKVANFASFKDGFRSRGCRLN